MDPVRDLNICSAGGGCAVAEEPNTAIGNAPAGNPLASGRIVPPIQACSVASKDKARAAPTPPPPRSTTSAASVRSMRSPRHRRWWRRRQPRNRRWRTPRQLSVTSQNCRRAVANSRTVPRKHRARIARRNQVAVGSHRHGAHRTRQTLPQGQPRTRRRLVGNNVRADDVTSYAKLTSRDHMHRQRANAIRIPWHQRRQAASDAGHRFAWGKPKGARPLRPRLCHQE